MGNDKDKLEKKRLKAQYKLEKKRLAYQHQDGSGTIEPPPGQPVTAGQPGAAPWYKDPNWLRAIAGVASLIVAIIALIIAFY